jgi:predicted nucleic acid-binding Zn ribbon protein
MKIPNPTHRKADVQSVGESLQDLIAAYRLQGKLTQARVLDAWPELMGRPVAQKTSELYFQNRKLFVRLTSAPLRHQLYMGRSEILRRVNEAANDEIIDEVVFL